MDQLASCTPCVVAHEAGPCQHLHGADGKLGTITTDDGTRFLALTYRKVLRHCVWPYTMGGGLRSPRGCRAGGLAVP